MPTPNDKSKLTHIDDKGRVNMVDVSAKATTQRLAIARGFVQMKAKTLDIVLAGKAKKGDVIKVAEVAGVMATKRTADLIPMCHPLFISGAKLDITPDTDLPGLQIQAMAKSNGQTGVEMEALTAVTVAGLTIYDMLKAVDKTMRIGDIELVEKRGGASGTYRKSDG